MTPEHDEPRLSAEDERFVRALDALYQPPESTAAARGRFAARLDERLARGRRRLGWRLAGATAAAALLALVVARLPGGERAPEGAGGTPAASVASPSADETLLLLANGPLEDPNEALPDDYQTLASLLD